MNLQKRESCASCKGVFHHEPWCAIWLRIAKRASLRQQVREFRRRTGRRLPGSRAKKRRARKKLLGLLDRFWASQVNTLLA